MGRRGPRGHPPEGHPWASQVVRADALASAVLWVSEVGKAVGSVRRRGVSNRSTRGALDRQDARIEDCGEDEP